MGGELLLTLFILWAWRDDLKQWIIEILRESKK